MLRNRRMPATRRRVVVGRDEPAATRTGDAGDAAARRGRSGGRNAGPANRPPDSPEAPGERKGPQMPELTIDEQADVVAEFLRGLADRFGVAGTETAIERVEEDTVEIRLQGGDLGLLIGPKGQTLHLDPGARPHHGAAAGRRHPGRAHPHRHRRLPPAASRGPRALHPAGGRRRAVLRASRRPSSR